ncbi:MAG: GntR family transcriptional regulator [Brevinema sp.]
MHENLSSLLDRTLMVPLYKQVEDIITKMLELPPYSEGQYLPGENELIESFNVGRHTVRQALQNLVNRGIIIREQGRGTRRTLKQQRIHTNIQAWSSFTSEMSNSHNFNKLKLVETGVKDISEEIQKVFNTTATRSAYLLRRYGYINETQTDIFFESFFDPELRLENDINFIEKRFTRLYDLLQETKGVFVDYSKETFEVVSLAQVPELLNIMDDIPLFKRTRLVFDRNKNLVEYNIGYYRTDVFAFNFESHLTQNDLQH